MPKLVIKNEIPPPSVQDRFIQLLQNLLAIFLVIIALVAIGYFYLVNRRDAPVVPPTLSTTVAPEGVKLPDDFCPLFGPNAGACKKTDK